MCGIAGFLHRLSLPEAETRLAAMLGSISYRGPDDLRGVVGPRHALGAARLAIVDIPGGRQPAVSPNGEVSVVFNGEIFGYTALREQLVQRGAVFHTHSEVETLLHLYLEHGIEAVKLLNGQFAIAIYDRRTNALHLVRDPFGIRPLFWLRAEDGFVFGSEIKALAAFSERGFELDRHSLLQALRLWTVTGDRTAFEGVHQIPPGHRLAIEHGAVSLHRYWTFPFARTVSPLTLASDEEYFEAFRAEFDRAVRRQTVADVAVGCYVSGGVDSAVLASCMTDHAARGKVETFSVGFCDPGYDESPAQQAVVDRLGLRNHSVRLRSDEVAAVFPEVVWHAETPLFRTAPAPLFQLARRVREAGIKVVMTGEGADEILLGYDLFREVEIRRFWARRPQSRWRGQLFRSLYQYLPQYRNPRYLGLLLDFYRGTLDADGPHYAMAVRWRNGKALEDILSRDMRADAEGYDPIADLERWLPPEYGDADDVERAQYIELMTLLPNYLLSSQGDRMSLAHGVEGRYPYLDLEFVRLAASLPRRIKLRGLKDKFVLRRSFEGKLSTPIAARPKFAYQAPELQAFFHDGTLVDYAADLLSESALREGGLFDPAAAARLVALGRANSGRFGFRDSMAFVMMVSTSLLQQQFGRYRSTAAAQRPCEITTVDGDVV